MTSLLKKVKSQTLRHHPRSGGTDKRPDRWFKISGLACKLINLSPLVLRAIVKAKMGGYFNATTD
jgi:hypothetical protein